MQTPSHPLHFQPTLHQRFQGILPQIQNCARFAFRRMPREIREDAIQDVTVQCYFAFCRLTRQGREEQAYPTVLARFAIRRYRAGRRAAGVVSARDASPQLIQCQAVSGGRREIPRRRIRWREMITEDRRTPIPEQVSFRLDFPAWLQRLSPDNRRCAILLARGYRGTEVARKLRVTTARISQVRRELHGNWLRFQSENPG